MLLQKFLENSADRLPDKTALIVGQSRITYQELDARANSFARALMDSGVEYGDRVIIFLDNSPENVISIFGALNQFQLHLLVKVDKVCIVSGDTHQ